MQESLTPSKHISVMLAEVEKYLIGDIEEKEDMLVLDCTFGGGGHSVRLLNAMPGLKLIGLDRDAVAVDRGHNTLQQFSERAIVCQGNFGELEELVATLPNNWRDVFTGGFDAVLADLGMSSDQLDDAQRGFSFQGAASLDMRFDISQKLTASDVVNNYSFHDLLRVFKVGGVGAPSRALAKAICDARPLEDTTSLRKICEQVIPRFSEHKKNKPGKRSHSATVCFQAIRIEVNQEFRQIKNLLNSLPEILRPHGRVAIISFHSLEDKYVTRQFRTWSRPGTVPRGLVTEQAPAMGKLLTKQAVVPLGEEIALNPRARSARLRVFERLQ
ncbi:MAG: 16S rRNA (cytosine(1402)-N(4))-methyltransferase RsmH [Deltaproteobacteria bacterium]|nr:16S rRNA (cytosine(1402)-N(4))-methyltransferase RsmH [Deltaproteobacteria bacterium]